MDIKLKKTIINISLILVFVLIYLLTVNFFSWFKIAGVMPNLFVIFILFIGLYCSKTTGAIFGVSLGILLDFFIGKRIGITAIMLGITGIIGGTFDKNFSKESRITIIIMVAISTFVYEIGLYIVNCIIYKTNPQIIEFIQILTIECLYNILITIILYPLMQKIGYMIEEEYKGNKILTRYF